MSVINRRRFLAGSAASAAVVGAFRAQAATEVDIAVVGAGAAGIAAARRVASTKARLALLEASDRVGGRCLTDTAIFGVPYDLGAHWIRVPDLNPVALLAASSGFEVYPAPPGQRVRIGRRYAREGEMESYLTAVVRANRAIGEAGQGKPDGPAAQALPKDLGDWQRTVEFIFGPFGCGKDLADVSAADVAHAADRDGDEFCRQGLGALIAKLAEGLPVQLASPATRIEWGARTGGVTIETAKGTVYARAAIVTVSTGVLAGDKIKFVPDLPRRQLDAIGKLGLGSYDHIALELAGNPLGLQRDEMVFEKSQSARTAAVLANLSGTPLCMIDVGGNFGRELAAAGDKAMVSFAVDWLAGLYGNDIKKAVRRTHATQWNNDPWTLGAMSAAAPGGQSARAALAEPLRNNLYFAGEATHETLWGTVGGAWASGERAADAVLRKLGPLADTPPPKPAEAPPRPRRR
jgi:monoamine oxidase